MSTLEDVGPVSDDKACFDASFTGVLGNVAAKMLQLSFTAHDVIEWLALPECASTAEMLVDVVGAAAFPMAQDFTQGDSVSGFEQRMEMIWHQAPGVELVSFAMSRQQPRYHQFSAGFPAKEALTVPCIEQFVKFGREFAVILFSLLIGQAV